MRFSYWLHACYFSQTSQHKQQAAWSIWKSTKYVLHLWNLATTSIHKKLQAPWECLHKSRRRQALTKERKQLEACNAVMNNPYQTAPHNHNFPGPPDKKQQVASSSWKSLRAIHIDSFISTTVAFSTLQASWTQTTSKRKKLDACNSNETRNAERVFMRFSYWLHACYFSQTSQHKQQAAWSIWKSTKYVLHLWNLATTSIHKKLQAPWECLHKSRRRQALTKERKQLEACNAVMNNPYQTAPHNHTFPGPPDKKQQVASHYFYNSGIFNTTSLVNTDNVQAKKARCL